MSERFKNAVIPDYPSRAKPQAFPEKVARSASGSIRMLEGLKPTSGNLAASESWRRMLGGRKRYNSERQQIAHARRNALLIWLMNHRMNYWCDLVDVFIPVERIVIHHGDGAMLAKALGVGKATVCRDLSALQAVQPMLFGKQTCGITYAEYMCGWRYSHRTGMGNEQPHHNLRFPLTQHGPAARRSNSVERNLPSSAPVSKEIDLSPYLETEEQGDEHGTSSVIPTVKKFLRILDENCMEHPSRNFEMPPSMHVTV
jgi:hypothetical protein